MPEPVYDPATGTTTYSKGPAAYEARERYPSGNAPAVNEVPPAPAPLDGGVTPAQQYSIATSASRDELNVLHGLLLEADKKVLAIMERFRQG